MLLIMVTMVEAMFPLVCVTCCVHHLKAISFNAIQPLIIIYVLSVKWLELIVMVNYLLLSKYHTCMHHYKCAMCTGHRALYSGVWYVLPMVVAILKVLRLDSPNGWLHNEICCSYHILADAIIYNYGVV